MNTFEFKVDGKYKVYDDVYEKWWSLEIVDITDTHYISNWHDHEYDKHHPNCKQEIKEFNKDLALDRYHISVIWEPCKLPEDLFKL